jgi:hypothetical protein
VFGFEARTLATIALMMIVLLLAALMLAIYHQHSSKGR